MDERYSRQVLFEPIGPGGQRNIRAGLAVVVGCGALGSMHVEMLARAGVGRLRIIDRDEIETSNLQRQVMFTEADVEAGIPKAAAAAQHVAAVNGDVQVEAFVQDLVPGNAESLLESATVVLDGTDNYETRELINEVCAKSSTPWIYGGCVGSEGTVLGIVPGRTPCLACVFGEAPAQIRTCDTDGIIAPAVAVVAGLQVAEALKVLSGNADALTGRLGSVDVWHGRMRSLDLAASRDPECRVCAQGRYEVLDGGPRRRATTLCGRGAIQIAAASEDAPMDLEALERKLSAVGTVRRSEYLLRAEIADVRLTVFADGRTLVKGTTDPAAARSIHARYIGA